MGEPVDDVPDGLRDRPEGLAGTGTSHRRLDLPMPLEPLLGTLRDHGVVFALIFGSRVEGRAGPSSDVDLAVWGDGPGPMDDWGLLGALPDTIDLVDLRTAPETLAGRIALRGVVVLDDDPVRRIRWQAETRKRYLDEAFRRERFRRDFAAAHG